MQEYSITDKQIHWLSQVIAKVNKAFVPARKDDSHTNLYFDATGNRIFGRWIDTPKENIILALNLDRQQFECLNQKLNVRFKISVFDKSLKIIEKNIGDYFLSLNMDIKDLSKPLHYEMPNYYITHIKEGELAEDGISQWKHYRELANTACLSMLGYLQIEGEIRIWPHHFDSGIYVQISELLGLGFGLAMEDSLIGVPYFYMAAYSGDSSINYENPDKLSLGEWETGEHWKGAVLSLNTIKDYSPDTAIEKIKIFIQETTNWFLNQ